MLAGKMMAGTASVALPVFISSSSDQDSGATTHTVTAPSGIQNGDLLIAVGFANDATVLITPPAGFNQIATNNAGTSTSQFTAVKVAASESGNYTFTLSNGTTRNTISILVYRNATKVNTVGSLYKSSNSNTLIAPSITPTYAGTLVGVFANNASSNAITSPPSGMTQIAIFDGASPGIAIYELANQSASATGTKTLTLTTSTSVAAWLLQITNEPTVAPEFVASASTQNGGVNTTLIINKPTGTIENDLMVAIMAASSDVVAWSGDTGWTEVVDDGANAPALRVAYKVAGASEASTYTFTVATGRTLSGSILTYRYAAYDTIGALTAGTDPLILPIVSVTQSQSILLAAGARGTAAITLGTPISMTARVTDNNGNQPSYIVCDQKVAKGPTGTRSMSTGALNAVGIMLSIKPTRSL